MTETNVNLARKENLCLVAYSCIVKLSGNKSAIKNHTAKHKACLFLLGAILVRKYMFEQQSVCVWRL